MLYENNKYENLLSEARRGGKMDPISYKHFFNFTEKELSVLKSFGIVQKYDRGWSRIYLY